MNDSWNEPGKVSLSISKNKSSEENDALVRSPGNAILCIFSTSKLDN